MIQCEMEVVVEDILAWFLILEGRYLIFQH